MKHRAISPAVTLVQLVEMFLKKSVPTLYEALGVYLPLRQRHHLGGVLPGEEHRTRQSSGPQQLPNGAHHQQHQSKKMDTAVGMGFAVIFVMALASALCYPVNRLLDSMGLGYMKTVAFILVIAALRPKPPPSTPSVSSA